MRICYNKTCDNLLRKKGVFKLHRYVHGLGCSYSLFAAPGPYHWHTQSRKKLSQTFGGGKRSAPSGALFILREMSMGGKKLSEEDLAALKRVVELFRAIDVNSLMNAYAIENVVFGKLKQGDKIPFEKFIEDLQIGDMDPYSVRDSIEGAAIMDEERIIDRERGFFERECFRFHMNYVFDSAPYSIRGDDDENGLRPFRKNGLNGYIMRLFPLFREILQTDAAYDYFELVSPFPDRFTQTACYEKIAAFLVAVITRGPRQGKCVDRYVKDLPYLPYYVKRILKMKNGRFILANSDMESLDFRLAVLSAIHFMNAEHTQLFERKARKWSGDL